MTMLTYTFNRNQLIIVCRSLPPQFREFFTAKFPVTSICIQFSFTNWHILTIPLFIVYNTTW